MENQEKVKNEQKREEKVLEELIVREREGKKLWEETFVRVKIKNKEEESNISF